MWLQLLEHNVGRNLANNIGHEKDRQGGIVIGAFLEVQVLLQSQNGCIADIDSARQ